MDQPLLIAGCTGLGKSKLAIELAKTKPSLIINADAIQVYNCWKILSARPSDNEMNSYQHSLYGHIPCCQQYDVGRWLKAIKIELGKAKKLNLRPIVVGGSGLYLSLLLKGIAKIPDISLATRKKSEVLFEKDFSRLVNDLEMNDPYVFKSLDRLNNVRIKRAWEVLEETGKSILYWQQKSEPPLLHFKNIRPIILCSETELINKNIENRFKKMILDGVTEEVDAVLTQTSSKDYSKMGAFKIIGFKEIKSYLDNKIDLKQLEIKVTTRTKQYAKRQRTWFRNKFSAWEMLSITEKTKFRELAFHIDK